MSNGGPGKKRSPGINILLFVVTLGIYWFVWLYKAFDEFGKHRGKDLKGGMWIALLVTALVIGIAVLGYASETAPEPPGFDAPFEEIIQYEIDAATEPIFLVGGFLMLVFFVLQLIYVKGATSTIHEAAQGHGLSNDANPALAVLFNLFIGIGVILPLVGDLLALAGWIIAIVWVVQVQKTLNEYWDRAAYQYPAQQPTYGPAAGTYSAGATQPQQQAGPQGQAQAYGGQPAPQQQEPPSQQEAPPRQPPAASQQPAEGGAAASPPPQQQPSGPTEEKTFACPNCQTHVTVNYTPGTPTPVQCHQCGQRGTIK